jgi:opacity protein-like surface antigen
MILRLILLGMMLFSSNILPAAAEELTEEQKEIAAEKINAAIDAAKSWLSVVDSGQYENSWNQSSQFFKDKVPVGQWETSLEQVRSPLGRALSREVANYQYLTYMPGAPKGEYVVIQFKTSFDEKPVSTETITPMLDKDGVWRVSGYYIK